MGSSLPHSNNTVLKLALQPQAQTPGRRLTVWLESGAHLWTRLLGQHEADPCGRDGLALEGDRWAGTCGAHCPLSLHTGPGRHREDEGHRQAGYWLI